MHPLTSISGAQARGRLAWTWFAGTLWAASCAGEPEWPSYTEELARPRLTLAAPMLASDSQSAQRLEALRFPRADGADWPESGPELRGPRGFRLRVAQVPQGVRLLLTLAAELAQRPGHWLRLRVSTDTRLDLPRSGWPGPDFEPQIVVDRSGCDQVAPADQQICHDWVHLSTAQQRAVLKLFRQEHIWRNSSGAHPPERTEMAARLGLDSPMPPPNQFPALGHRSSADQVAIEWFLPWDSLPLTQHAPLSQLLLGLHLCRSESACDSLLPVSNPRPNDAVRVRLNPVRPYQVGACDLPLLGLHLGQGRWLTAAYFPRQTMQIDTLYTLAAPSQDLRNGVRGLAPSPQLWDWTLQSIPLGPDEYLCGPRVAWRRATQRLLGSVPTRPGAREPGVHYQPTPPIQVVALDVAQAIGRYWLVLEPPDHWFRRYGMGAQAGEPGLRSALWLLDRREARLRVLWEHLSEPTEAVQIRYSGDLRRIEVHHWDEGEPRRRQSWCLETRGKPERAKITMRACDQHDPVLPPENAASNP